MKNDESSPLANSDDRKSNEPMLPIASEKTAWRSIYIAGCCSFIQSTQFAIFFASMWPYILTLQPDVKQSSFGIVVAMYSFSQCIFSPVFGYWSNTIGQVRLPLIVGFCIMALGNLTYLSLQFLHSYHLYVMMLARLIAGAGTGNMSLLRAYASTSSTLKDRSRAIACVSGGIAMGSMIGPGLQILFSPLGENGIKILGISISIYTSPAILCLILNIIGLLTVKLTFKEKYIIQMTKNENNNSSSEEKTSLKNPDYIAIFVCIATRFSQIFLGTTLESIGSAYSMMMFSFGKETSVTVNAIMHTVGGAFAALFYIVFIFSNIKKYIKARLFTLLSLSLSLIWIISTYPYGFLDSKVTIAQNGSDADCDLQKYSWCTDLSKVNIVLYYSGFIIIFSFLFSVLNITVTTLYSKIVGPRPQGTYQGIFQMAGSIGRLIAPLLMSSLYTLYGPSAPWFTLGINYLLIILLWVVFRNRIVPFEKYISMKSVNKQQTNHI